jgi:hypothetical protein
MANGQSFPALGQSRPFRHTIRRAAGAYESHVATRSRGEVAMAETALRLEYGGFVNTGTAREFSFRIHASPTTPVRSIVLVITDAAFSAGQAKYQDGPDICYQTLLKMAATLDPAAERVVLSEEDLYNYRHAHAPKPPRRRAPVIPQPAEGTEVIRPEPIRDNKAWRP